MGSLHLGTTKRGKDVAIDARTRSTHMHVIGASGEGKSKFMEHMIREDIKAGNGLCLIDPHGYLYDDLVRWCASKRMLDRAKPKKIILFNPSEQGWTFGFNPLGFGRDGGSVSYHVDAMVKAVAKVWGGEDTDRTPLLKRCLRVLFHALAEKKLSLLEAQYLTDRVDKTVRTYLTHDITDQAIRQEWAYFNSLKKPKEFYDEFGSTINRMLEFLSSPIIRNIIGQTEGAIDFREVMDEGHILFVNLAAADRISDDNARLLGTLIVNDLFMKAKGRPKGSRSFYLYIDECARYINEDTQRILDEGRKFGLHLILAHQHLAQLRKIGEDIYHAVMTDAKTKVIFGGLNAEDARTMAENVFMGEIDLEEAKTTLSKPAVVGYVRTWLENYSRGRSSTRGEASSESRGGGESTGGSTGSSSGRSHGAGGDCGGGVISEAESSGTSRSFSSSWGAATSSSSSETESESYGRSEALEPILQEMPSQVFSLEEQIYKVMSLMVNQPMQHAIIKLPKKKPRVVKTPFIEDGIARRERVDDFKNRCFQRSSFVHRIGAVEDAIAARHRMIEAAADGFASGRPQGGGEQDDKEDFYE